ncbi:hypothetical protein QBC41DRAFT_57134 [Cercophora samala]|uniref:Uncharacterized protein n=1 Tax=Cercophora samala TaxID=330535 RepID=A0AA39YV06_9PEZI|nr:hypothetical protein QBC41DRAFT_57134 [Cercophora samala]
MLIKRKDGGNRGFGGHFKMPGKSKDFDLGATWENKVEGLFTKLEASQPSQEDIQKQQEKLRQEQDDAVAAQRKKDEEERARLAEENARRNGPKTTSTTTTTTATTKKPKNEPSTTGASSTFIKLSQVNTARTTSQVSSPSLAKETPVNERPDSSNDVVVVTEVPSTTPPTTLGPNTPEPPAETDPTISTFTPQHTLNAGQIAAIVISSIGESS